MTNPSSRQDEGFTLVEVLVALAIFAISIGVVFQVVTTNLDRTRQVRDQTVAISLLQSLLARNNATQPGGTSEGVFPNGFHWRLRVEPFDTGTANDSSASGSDSSATPVTAVKIIGSVSWGQGRGAQTRSLATLRVVPAVTAQ